MKKAIKWILNLYYDITGLNVLFFDNKAGEADLSSCPEDSCPFCNLIQTYPVGKEICQKSMQDNSMRSVEYGYSYIFHCPFGLVTWIAPVMVDDNFMGYFLSEAIFMRPLTSHFMEEIKNKTMHLGIETYRLNEALKKVKIISEKKVKSSADFLHISANYLSEHGLMGSQKRREKYIQQAKISEEIQKIKRKELALLEKKEIDESAFISISSLYPLETERELLKRVRLGDQEGAKEVLNEILGKILFKNAGNIELVRARLLELAVVLSRAAVEGMADLEMILGLNLEHIQEFGKIKTIEELCIWIVKVLDRFTESVFKNRNIKNVDIIRKARGFIRANYKKKLKLSDISSSVSLSPYYLSHIFKDETGVTLMEYVTKVRIEEAKRLLEDTPWNTTRISYEIGYQDQSYFCKIFKKIEGISPLAYKKGVKN